MVTHDRTISTDLKDSLDYIVDECVEELINRL